MHYLSCSFNIDSVENTIMDLGYVVKGNRLLTYEKERLDKQWKLTSIFPLFTEEDFLAYQEHKKRSGLKHEEIDSRIIVVLAYYRKKFGDKVKPKISILRFVIDKLNLPYSCEEGSTLMGIWNGKISKEKCWKKFT